MRGRCPALSALRLALGKSCPGLPWKVLQGNTKRERSFEGVVWGSEKALPARGRAVRLGGFPVCSEPGLAGLQGGCVLLLP